MKPAKKSLVYLGGKMRFEFWPLWQCWAVWPIRILFSCQGRLKIFLAGFIKYLNFKCPNLSYALIPFLSYVIAKFFQGGYRTKMKIWSDENEKLVGKFFARLWRAKKRGSQIFRLMRAFFRRGGTENH